MQILCMFVLRVVSPSLTKIKYAILHVVTYNNKFNNPISVMQGMSYYSLPVSVDDYFSENV